MGVGRVSKHPSHVHGRPRPSMDYRQGWTELCIRAVLRSRACSVFTMSRYFAAIRSGIMISQEKDIETTIPDLRDIPVNRLAELGSSALAHSIALYRERLRENGIPLSSFQARI